VFTHVGDDEILLNIRSTLLDTKVSA